MSWEKKDLKLLCKYAIDRKFIMETGGGVSTKKLAKVAKQYGSIMVSIEIDNDRVCNMDGIDHQVGWSITYKDIIKKNDKQFIETRKKNKYPYEDRNVAVFGEKYMNGENDLIRKSIKKYGFPPDFFFCDTGEYCGLAEWNVVKDIISVNGVFACHDIYYPKSIKCFQIVKEIEKSKRWKVLKKTASKQGFFVAKKIL